MSESFLWKVLVGGGQVEWCGSIGAAASKGVVVAVFGLAEFVEEEDDGLQAQDQHYSTNEARSIEGWVLVGGRSWRGNSRAVCSCDKEREQETKYITLKLPIGYYITYVKKNVSNSQCQTYV